MRELKSIILFLRKLLIILEARKWSRWARNAYFDGYETRALEEYTHFLELLEMIGSDDDEEPAMR